jgi:hypothetical protein
MSRTIEMFHSVIWFCFSLLYTLFLKKVVLRIKNIQTNFIQLDNLITIYYIVRSAERKRLTTYDNIHWLCHLCNAKIFFLNWALSLSSKKTTEGLSEMIVKIRFDSLLEGTYFILNNFSKLIPHRAICPFVIPRMIFVLLVYHNDRFFSMVKL